MDDSPPDPSFPDPRLPAHTPLDAPAAARLARGARAAEELCATLWEAMRDELGQPRVRRVAEIAERLSQVCSAVAALAAEGPAREREPPAPAEVPEIAVHDIRGEGPAASVAEPPAPPAGTAEFPPSLRAHPAEPSPPGPTDAGGPSRPGPTDTRGLFPPGPTDAGGPPAAWAEPIEAQLERHAVDGLPFAVLLVEVPDVERLARTEPAAQLALLLEGVERAFAPELRCTDTVVREGGGRWWLTASRTDAGGALVLAERMARAVRAASSHRGVPLDLAIGVAVCPVDGGDAAALAAHADVGLYAARAAGRPVAPVDDAA